MYPALKEILNIGWTGVQKGYLTFLYEYILHKSKRKRKKKRKFFFYNLNKLLDLNTIQTSQYNMAIV